MNPSFGAVPATAIEVRTRRGSVLPGRAWCADAPRAVVAIIHGLGDHSGRYAALASNLVGARYTVVSVDLPGHGAARGSRGDFPSWIEVRDEIVRAMFTASRELPGQSPELPAILLGQSLGGLIALDHALSHPERLLGVVALSPAVRTPTPPRWKLALGRLARATSPGAGLASGLEAPALSRDPEVVRLYQKDPLVHDRVSPRTYFAMLEAQARVLGQAPRLTVPVLVLQGSADRIVLPGGPVAFAAAAPNDMIRLLTYSGAYHEILNDIGRERAREDLVAWMEAVVV